MSPLVVEALVEEINITCLGWEDDDGGHDELMYNFFVERLGFSGDWYPLYRGPQWLGNFTLAPWSDSRYVRVYVYVEDRQGGRTLGDVQ